MVHSKGVYILCNWPNQPACGLVVLRRGRVKRTQAQREKKWGSKEEGGGWIKKRKALEA